MEQEGYKKTAAIRSANATPRRVLHVKLLVANVLRED